MDEEKLVTKLIDQMLNTEELTHSALKLISQADDEMSLETIKPLIIDLLNRKEGQITSLEELARHISN